MTRSSSGVSLLQSIFLSPSAFAGTPQAAIRTNNKDAPTAVMNAEVILFLSEAAIFMASPPLNKL
jgi:hypothetical protein